MHPQPEAKPLAQVTELAGRQRWGTGALLPAPSPQSHAAPPPSSHLQATAPLELAAAQQPPRAWQAGLTCTRGCPRAARGARWEERTCSPAPGRLEGWQAVAGAGPGPLVLRGLRTGKQIPSSQSVRALLLSAHSSLPRILTPQVTASQGKSEWQPQSSSMSSFLLLGLHIASNSR